jgi:hypothetical protein
MKHKNLNMIGMSAMAMAMASDTLTACAPSKPQGGYTPQPQRWGHKLDKYIVAGPRKNVRGTFVKNPKQAQQMRDMHDNWKSKKFKT